MAEEYNPNQHHRQEEAVESTDRGLFDFMKKKEDHADHPKPEEEVVVGEYDQKVYVSDEPKEKKERFHRSNSSSSSSSGEEEGTGIGEEEKKKKKDKRSIKEKISDKFPLKGGEEKHDTEASKVHVQEVAYSEPSYPEADHEKKGLMDKLPGQHNKPEEDEGRHHPPPTEYTHEGQEKKGLVEKVKDKLPGQHNKPEEEVAAAHRPPPTEYTHEGQEKKGLVEKVKEKLPGQQKKPEEEVAAAHRPPPTEYTHEGQEKKGLVEKVKDKLPGHQKKLEEEVVVVPPHEYEEPEKKGFLEKIKKKLPGFQSKGEEENKDKERD